jgi:hypothetical protein
VSLVVRSLGGCDRFVDWWILDFGHVGDDCDRVGRWVRRASC